MIKKVEVNNDKMAALQEALIPVHPVSSRTETG